MKNFFIVAKDKKESTLAFVREIASYIEGKGGSCSLGFNPDDAAEEQLNLPADCDCILSFGGDGTLIRAAQNTFGSGVPMVGVNGGHLGYLCDLSKTTVFEGIDAIMSGNFTLEERMMLSGQLVSASGETVAGAQALNDIVVYASAGLQLLTVTVYVNGSYLYTYDCDGVIFSTPTGSTAYNLSVGGPIVNPKTNLILLTPINPHTLNARSIVLDPYDELMLEVKNRNATAPLAAAVAYDGNHRRSLQPGDRLIVRRAKETTSMIHLEDLSFLDRIRTRMQEL